MRLAEVDVVGLQPGRRGVDRVEDVLAGQATSLWPFGPVGPNTFVKISQRLTPLALQCLAQDRLHLGVGIDVGRVEPGDPGVEGGVEILKPDGPR